MHSNKQSQSSTDISMPGKFQMFIDPKRLSAFRDKKVHTVDELREAVVYFQKIFKLCEGLDIHLSSGEKKSEDSVGALVRTVSVLATFQWDIYNAIDFDNFEGAQPIDEILDNMQQILEILKKFEPNTYLFDQADSINDLVELYNKNQSHSLIPINYLEEWYEMICVIQKVRNYETFESKHVIKVLGYYREKMLIERKKAPDREYPIQSKEEFQNAYKRFKKFFECFVDYYEFINKNSSQINEAYLTNFYIIMVDILEILKNDTDELKNTATKLGMPNVRDEISDYSSDLFKRTLVTAGDYFKLDNKIFGSITQFEKIIESIDLSNNKLNKVPKVKKEISEAERQKIAEGNRKLMEAKNAVKEEEKVDTKSKIIHTYPQFTAILKDVNESDPKKLVLVFESKDVKDINNLKTIFTDRSVKGIKVTRNNQNKLTLEFNQNQLENTLLNNTNLKSKIGDAFKLPATQQEPQKPAIPKPKDANQNNAMEPSEGDKNPAKRDLKLTEDDISAWAIQLAKLLGLDKEDIRWVATDQIQQAHFRVILKVSKQLKFGDTTVMLTEKRKNDLLSRIAKYFDKHPIAKLNINGNEVTIIPLSQRPGNLSLLQEQINNKFCEETAPTVSKPITLFQPKAEKTKPTKSKTIDPKELRKQEDIEKIISFLGEVTNCDLANKNGLLEFSALEKDVFTFDCHKQSISTNNLDEPPHETGEFFSKLAKVINAHMGKEVVTFADKKLTVDNNVLNKLVEKQALIKAEFESIAKASYTPVGKLEEVPVSNKTEKEVEEATNVIVGKIKSIFCIMNTDEALKNGFLRYLRKIISVDYDSLTDDQKYAAFFPWATIVVNALSEIAEEDQSNNMSSLHALRNILRHAVHDISVDEIENIYLPFFRKLENCFTYFTSKQFTLWTDSEILTRVKRELTECTSALLNNNLKFKKGLSTYSLQITQDFVNSIEDQMMLRVRQGDMLSVPEFLFFILIKGEAYNSGEFYRSIYVKVGHWTTLKESPDELLDRVYKKYDQVHKQLADNPQTYSQHRM